ncbi:MAG: tetratricopeptide repeat protein [Nonlabens sp.]
MIFFQKQQAKQTLISIFFFACSSMLFSLSAQDMQEGFSYLEQGNFEKAETFFEQILKEYPQNKTARLCYARAIGLNGKAPQALDIFIELREEYPSDFEIKLNYAESLLWNEKYEDAEAFYAKLVKEQPQSFPAVLGYANTLSNLKKYPEAIEWIDKAVAIDPDNGNARISKKYIQIAYADQLVKAGNYDKGTALLQDNLDYNSTDLETLLNLANAYIIQSAFAKAMTTYQRIEGSTENELRSLNGQALVHHLMQKDKRALEKSDEAVDLLDEEIETDLALQTRERHIQTLIWNGKYNKAEKEIDRFLTVENPSQKEKTTRLALLATLETYKADFNKSTDYYTQLLEADSLSFDGNLGSANSLFAQGRYSDAYRAAQQTLAIYAGQKDAIGFLAKLNGTFLPSLGARASYSFDNGDNIAYTLNGGNVFQIKETYSLLLDYGLRSTENQNTNATASAYNFAAGVDVRLAPLTYLKAMASLSEVRSDANNYTELLPQLSIRSQALTRQSVELGYRRDVQNFNTDLLDRKLIQDNFFLNHNLSTTFDLGWYNQYYFTSQNDGNNRHLYFTSLYYNFLKKPSLKGGLNYQFISFDEQRPAIYFSPEQFHAVEVFVNLNRDLGSIKTNQFFYDATFATGYQFIEDNDKQSTYRVNASLGYKFAPRFVGTVFAGKSNIASTTAAGFEFTEMGITIKWLLTDKPLFSFGE